MDQMEFWRCEKVAFSVIGFEGSTDEGAGFIARLWEKANARFPEIAHLVKCDPSGALVGIWGLMSDKSRAFLPWQKDFSDGLYLAGAEVRDDAQPPAGWTKWTSPAYEYVCAKMESPDSFAQAIQYLKDNRLALAGAVYDKTDLANRRRPYVLPDQKAVSFHILSRAELETNAKPPASNYRF